MRFWAIYLFGIFIVVQCIVDVHSKRCRTKPPRSPDTRPGRCPHPQYAFSSLPCSTEGNDTVCPWNYKCCPLIQGMQCFAPCPELPRRCRLKCQFGYKVDPSPCTTCKCAEDPCRDPICPLGTTCIPKPYTPCAIPGRCGFTVDCIRNSMNDTNPVVKPNNCPDYWPQFMSGTDGLVGCVGSDALCPGDQKCCEAPISDFRSGPSAQPPESAGTKSFCVDPCISIENCTLECSFGFRISGGCRLCECLPDPCQSISCPPGQQCRLLPTPCAYYPGRPPCPLLPACMP